MASGPIFTDTSAWYAYIDKSDTEHAAAVKLVKNLDRPLITSNYIFDEVLTLVKLRMGYHVAINLGQKLLNQDVAGLVRLTKAMNPKHGKFLSNMRIKALALPIALPMQ